MAHHPSAERRNRQRIKRSARNKSVKSSVRTGLRKARATISAEPGQAATLVRDAESRLDRAASKGILHRRTAARLKSRLYAQLHKAKTAATPS